MAGVDLTDRSQTDAVTFEFELPHPPAKVWRALTEPALLAEWLLPATNFSPEPGAAFTFNAPPQPGWDGRVNCRVLEIDVDSWADLEDGTARLVHLTRPRDLDPDLGPEAFT